MLADLKRGISFHKKGVGLRSLMPNTTSSRFSACLKGLSAILFILIVTLVSGLIVGCNSPHNQKRPPTYLTLGFVEDLKRPETYLADKRLLLRLDEGGFWVMSTQCPYDSSPLRPKEENGKIVLASDLSTSTYALDGEVLSGPARYALPFYELEIAEHIVGGPKDTLYVKLGAEVDGTWRLTP